MALNAYLAATKQLLQNPAAPTSLYSDANLTTWINQARSQLAGESLSVRVQATLAILANNAGPYLFSAFNLGGASGVQGVINARTIWLVSGAGRVWLTPRSYDWFAIYNLNIVAPVSGTVAEWAQYGQGINGTVYVSPPPSGNSTLVADTVCYPVDLVSDATAEAIPSLWTTAVPYFAAYLALMSAQTNARMDEAEKMLSLYEVFTTRARKFANPDVLPLQYQQATPDVRPSQFGGGQARGAA